LQIRTFYSGGICSQLKERFSSHNLHAQPAERGDGRERYLRAPPARLNYLSHIEQTQFPTVSFAFAKFPSNLTHSLSLSRIHFYFLPPPSFFATVADIFHSFSFSFSLSFSLSPSLTLSNLYHSFYILYITIFI